MTPMRPWHPIPIADNGEPLQALPSFLLRIEPHPYRQLGAPYGPDGCPFRLRQGVIERLRRAQLELAATAPGWRLAIFDAWRPVAVQRFMVEHAIREECLVRGVDPDQEGPERDAAVEAVGRFWAPPSDDPATPPPHSTGAAVDLTLADASGRLLAMGGEIDAIGILRALRVRAGIQDDVTFANLSGQWFEVGDNQLNDAFRRFKDLADRKKVVYDEDISALVDDQFRDNERIKLIALDVRSGTRTKPTAEMELEVDGKVVKATETGDGPVDATFKAIHALFPHTANLQLFQIGAITEGTDAQARTTVRLEENGKLVDGQGADTDTIVASARAYIHALNKLIVKRERTQPAE